MTGANFGGGSEFAAIGLWSSPPQIALLVGVTLLINSRHLLMGAAFAPLLNGTPLWKAMPVLFFMCDESWAMGMEEAQRRNGKLKLLNLPYYMGISIGLYVVWISFTTLGASMGALLGDIEHYGLHMAFPAVFLVLLKGMWKGTRAALPWLVSLIIAATVHWVVPGAWYVAAGAAAGLLASYLLHGDSP